MTQTPLVSVIIAVKNGERYLASAIESVTAQRYTPIEILVIDGHSTDRTPAIAQSFKQVRYIPQKNNGIADGYNLGIEHASGELLAFISHDDLWEPDKISRQVMHIQAHPEIQYTVTKVRFFLEDGFSIPTGFKEDLLREPQVGRIMETLLARKSLFELIGTFDTSLSIAQDVDWYARAKDKNIPMAVIPLVLVHKRIHDGNASSKAELNNRQLLKVMRRSIKRQRMKHK